MGPWFSVGSSGRVVGLPYMADSRRMADMPLMSQIARAVRGEHEAAMCYTRLAELAPSASERKQILEIRDDEVRHLQAFGQIHANLTEQQVILRQPTCPDTYVQGLDAFIRDELENVDAYLTISEQARDPMIRQAFFRAALDEQNHAGWFTYFLLKQSTTSR